MESNINSKLEEAKHRMEGAIKHLEGELVKIRAGRATPDLLKDIKVDYYGQTMPINQVANIAVADARTLIIQPWEKNMLEPIEKEILKANLGFTPVNNGKVIRITIPELTQERREQLAKQVKKEGEEAKVAVRNVRRDIISAIKKLKDQSVSEDAIKDALDEMEDITKDFIEKIDKIVKKKTEEIMTV